MRNSFSGDSLVELLLLVLSCARWAAGEEGFCSAPPSVADSGSKPLYWKVTNPTLSPTHLEDLPGFTRSVYKRDHALITPESHVFSPLPDWINTWGAYLISPAMGSHFTMYLAKMQMDSRSASLPANVERFLFVIQGTATLSNSSGVIHKLDVDTYAYLPANLDHVLKCDTTATLVIFERRYVTHDSQYPEQIVGLTDKQPLLETPGEVFELRKLLPTSAPYDFNIHIMDFQPGEYLNVKEVHYNQHGLLLLEGQGIYRLGDNWYPVQAGDAIWMAPFVPQWYAALGKARSRYLLYKDVNRNPFPYHRVGRSGKKLVASVLQHVPCTWRSCRCGVSGFSIRNKLLLDLNSLQKRKTVSTEMKLWSAMKQNSKKWSHCAGFV